jgi:hypothetical protein
MMPIRILSPLILLAILVTGCYVRNSYTLNDYLLNNYMTNNGRSIISVTKTNGEKIFFSGDGGKYDATSDMVIGPVPNDSEVSIPSREIRLVNTERPNPMMPFFEGLVVAAGAVVVFVLLYFAISPPRREYN